MGVIDEIVDTVVHGIDSVEAFVNKIRSFGYDSGVSVYYITKRAAEILNVKKKQLKIYPDTSKRLSMLFPDMNLSNIRIIKDATLPANIFNSEIKGMTFENRIYLAVSEAQYNYSNFLLLIHEMIHIKQIRNFGETDFAGEYGKEFLDAGGYGEKMKLEAEAYGYVSKLICCAFDPQFYYMAHLKDCLSQDDPIWDMRAFAHFLDDGIIAGLQSHQDFCAKKYLEKYPDLINAFGADNYPAAFRHWLEYGIDEKRIGV